MARTSPVPKPKPEMKERASAVIDGLPQWKGQARPQRWASTPNLMKSRADDKENGVGMSKLEQQTSAFGLTPSCQL